MNNRNSITLKELEKVKVYTAKEVMQDLPFNKDSIHLFNGDLLNKESLSDANVFLALEVYGYISIGGKWYAVITGKNMYAEHYLLKPLSRTKILVFIDLEKFDFGISHSIECRSVVLFQLPYILPA
ncbi:hypothetical protein A2V49_01805 [candidate division WWE3 bacterium RBG_19FT_COMBO_34_6]|uniref:Uncharacterized protein n=1 Tax=candidate division WWE3 bacterium RBG_19FT_COMBO_34_6 TaxID=1802612 RepID=A0A1F4UMY0_UNCKA|nr:MAG: hypothetical protein A2V49_01805 [candidate division WWE3 bacterium RBG_19FT_COMBO_34_6]